ncbi:MAG: hypothetical protein REI78_10375 [Pedobacter sp.]|nr:hypothetical protein [Pedobacter sp.]
MALTTKLKLIIVVLLLVLQAQTCKKDDPIEEVPTCILDKIEQMKKDNVANPPASVWQYEYNGKIVYYVPAKCCDIPSVLYDGNCNVICSPDGGFTGAGDGKCADFFKKRTNEKLIWKDPRK